MSKYRSGKSRGKRKRASSPRWQFRPYCEALAFAQSLGLRDQLQWRKYCRGDLRGGGRRPKDIPAAPDYVYRNDGWRSWGDWLGTGTVATQLRRYRTFDDARKFVRQLGLRNQMEWVRYSNGELRDKGKRPDDIPAVPGIVYKNDGWLSWGDWLGTGTVAPQRRRYRRFRSARAYVRQLGLRSQAEWNRYCKGELRRKGKRPDDVPTAPHRTYENAGWLGWGDWLGTGTVASRLRRYRAFREARAFVRQLGLHSQQEWDEYCKNCFQGKPKKPGNIPATPYRVYRGDGWQGWGDWLGTNGTLRLIRPKASVVDGSDRSVRVMRSQAS